MEGSAVSATMYVRRPPIEGPQVYVDSAVQYLIAPTVFGSDGTLAGVSRVDRGDHLHYYLQGLRDASPLESLERRALGIILEMIDVYDAVELEIKA
jgi:hypothetical protein